MFKFFTNKNWYPWSLGGTVIILMATWFLVQIDVQINQWFGEFYDALQKALTSPNSVFLDGEPLWQIFIMINGTMLHL